ncbi:MAG: hypothetical protein KKB51_15380 [Candidatus Riflebacteria bacterium]|nr:hypothetical protein [Candidatus Riflebacteria bacterium]
MKISRKHLAWFFATVVLAALIFGTWLYVEIWVPNRALSQYARSQDDSEIVAQEKLRTLCHKIISHRLGNHHDAFITLENVGNRDSIPYLLHALSWQEMPDADGTVVCTTEHCVSCLQKLTGMDFGFSHYDWNKWWQDTGSKLSSEELAKRATNSGSVDQ